MTSVVERCKRAAGAPVFICDFSPPRGADRGQLEAAGGIPADFISVAYNPGKSPRLNPVFGAHWIKDNTGRDVLFTLSTRDMNKIAVQGLLLGADLMGLENVVVVGGDPFRPRDLELVKTVDDYRPTGLIASIRAMNEGVDFKGLSLRTRSGFCVGATIDLSDSGAPMERQVRLTHRKVEAGAGFFLLQALFEPERLTEFVGAYAEAFGEALEPPIFCGVQVMVPGGITFGTPPQWVSDGLARGGARGGDGGSDGGVDIAVELIGRYADAGFSNIYLVPPIFKGGRRDYEAAASVLQAVGRS